MTQRSFKSKRWISFGFALIAVLILPVIFLYPFNVDTDHWQWISSVFVRYGGLPYVAAWDHDFPGIMVVHATAMYLFGTSMLSFRLIEYIAILVTVFILFRVSRLWLNETQSFVSAFIFALFYAYGRWDCMGQRDNFAVLPILLAIYWHVTASRSNDAHSKYWRIATASAMIGIATCIRPTHSLLLAAPIFTLYGISDFRAMAFASIGFLLPLAITIVPYSFIPGGLHRAYTSTFIYNKPIFSNSWNSGVLRMYIHDLGNLRSVAVYVMLSIWFLGYLRLRAKGIDSAISRSERLYLTLFYLIELIGIFMQPTLSGHHFTPFFTCFIPLLVTTASKVVGDTRWRKPAFVAILVAIAAVLYPFGLVKAFIQGGFSIDSAYRYFGPLHGLEEVSTIASYVTSHTVPSNFVGVIGDPGVAWRIPRRPFNEFPSEWYFIWHESGLTTDYQRRWRTEYLRSLQEKLPQYIIVHRDPQETAQNLFCISMKYTPEIANFIQRHYSLDRLLRDHAIYSRR